MFSCTYLCVLREREREKKNQSVIITSLCLESTPAASHCAVVYSVKDRNYSLHILFCSSSKKCFPLNYYLLFFCNYIQDGRALLAPIVISLFAIRDLLSRKYLLSPCPWPNLPNTSPTECLWVKGVQ
uniref:Uncharacterized protein n=1 Tax=Magallana gigas TaxID=29159 RepID=K1PNJ1_MAGGI